MQVTIDRTKWDRGSGPCNGVFLRPDGRRCIFGWILAAEGCTDEELLNQTSLSEFGAKADSFMDLTPYGFTIPSRFADRLITTNDSPFIGDERRETELKLFASPRYDLIFIN